MDKPIPGHVRNKLPRKNNAKSGFPVYCWHAHTDGRVIQGESTSRSAAAGKGRRGGRRRGNSAFPCGGWGGEARAGASFATETEPRQADLRGPQEALKMALLDDTSCLS